MATALPIFFALAFWVLVYRPCARERAYHERAAFIEEYRNFQAFAVLKYHRSVSQNRELWNLSIDDLRRDYNVSEAYEQIGRY